MSDEIEIIKPILGEPEDALGDELIRGLVGAQLAGGADVSLPLDDLKGPRDKVVKTLVWATLEGARLIYALLTRLAQSEGKPAGDIWRDLIAPRKESA